MTRRTLLSFFPGALLAVDSQTRGKKPAASVPQSGFVRFADPVTENVVVRLTAPDYTSLLPLPSNSFISARDGFLLFSCDRMGQMAPFRMNLRNGAMTQVAETATLAPRSLTLDAREKKLLFLDGEVLKDLDLQNLRSRTLAEGITAFHCSSHGDQIVTRRGNRLERLAAERAFTLADDVSSRGLVSPKGESCVFSRARTDEQNELWFAPFNGDRPRLLVTGRISSPCWRPDGQAILFLKRVERGSYEARVICEVGTEGGPERLVSETSQFATISPNGDGTVFVGASCSRAQPDVVILLRESRREMVLCEHRSKTPETVAPSFSPNSQRIYFQSEHEGKPTLYSMNVEQLIERTKD